MQENREGTSQSKWELTHEALQSALVSLPGALNLGLVLFPQVPVNEEGSCFREETAVHLAVLDGDQRERCSDALGSAEIDGNTPTYDAYAYAAAQLEQRPRARR